MANISLETVLIPRRYCGLRVLLVEHDKESLKYHSFVLSQNSYRVTSTHQPSAALSMISNGRIYDCVLADADMWEMDGMEFLNHALQLRPNLPIIMMASPGIYMNIASEASRNKAILCIMKPSALNQICNLWHHVHMNKRASQDPILKGESPQGNVSLDKSTDQQGPELNRNKTRTTMFKPITYDDLFGSDTEDDAGTVIEGNIHEEKIANADEEKQPVEGNSESDEEERVRKKQRKISTNLRITWTPALQTKFLEALDALGDGKAYPNAILKYMNVPGLSRDQVASHLQRFREGINQLNDVLGATPPVLRGDNSLCNVSVSTASSSLLKPPSPMPNSGDYSLINRFLGNRSQPSTLFCNSSSLLKPSPMLNSGDSYSLINHFPGNRPQQSTLFNSVSTSTTSSSLLKPPLTLNSDDHSLINRFVGNNQFTSTTSSSLLKPPLTLNSDDHSLINRFVGNNLFTSTTSSSLLKPPVMLNSTGASYMSMESIKSRLQESPNLPPPPLTEPQLMGGGTSFNYLASAMASLDAGATQERVSRGSSDGFGGIDQAQDCQGLGGNKLISATEEETNPFNVDDFVNASYPDFDSLGFLFEDSNFNLPPFVEEEVDSQRKMQYINELRLAMSTMVWPSQD